jgi:methyl-accepting chemotaxis protein
MKTSIEAARAGEYGRGFTLAAKNVQKLFDETKNGSESIGSKVGEISGSVQGTMEDIRRFLSRFTVL